MNDFTTVRYPCCNWLRSCNRRTSTAWQAMVTAAWLLGAHLSPLYGETVTFQIQPEESFLAVAGTFSGFPLISQSDEIAGDIARYGGTITVELDDRVNPTEIQFLSAFADAQPTGFWLPELGGGSVGDPEVEGDSDPGVADEADYGILLDAAPLATAWGAFRDLAFNFSTLEILSVDDGKFTSGQLFEAAQGTWETNIRSMDLGDDAGIDDVTGDSAFNDGDLATYSIVGNQARMEIPVLLIFPGTVEFTFEGVLIATAPLGQGTPGDFNGDSQLDAADINLLTEAVNAGENPVEYDLNGDQLVDAQDRRVWVSELKATWFGDANLDGIFDTADFVSVFTAGQYEDQELANSVWETGDWNGDNEFDSGDFVVAFSDGGFEQGPKAAVAAVPEPTATTLVAFALTSLVFRRRRG